MTGDPRNEAELCELFAEAARADGWDVYPEVESWDLLLVWRGVIPDSTHSWRFPRGVPAGFQMGVEAKMRANVDVLKQAADRMSYGKRPDVGAVLVPDSGLGRTAFVGLAGRLDLLAFDLANCGERRARHPITPPWPNAKHGPADRVGPVLVPPVPLQSAGGQASPRTMSKWRVGALRLVIKLEARGFLTHADFKAQGADKRLWLEREWLVREGAGAGARYLPGPEIEIGGGPASGYRAELEALRAHDAKEVA